MTASGALIVETHCECEDAAHDAPQAGEHGYFAAAAVLHGRITPAGLYAICWPCVEAGHMTLQSAGDPPRQPAAAGAAGA